jgi:hypothetical protein
VSRRDWLIFLLLLVPSLVAAWWNRDMPYFGWGGHDDGVYFVGAKALASGEGHKIVSLPGEPWQTKYPPLYPLLLSLVWKIAPDFPQNLPLATAFAWLFLPAVFFLCHRLLLRYGFPGWWAWLLVGILAVNPYVGVFSRSLFTELPFTLLLLSILLVARHSGFIAGSLAGAAFLTRTSALPLAIVLPVYYVWRRQRRDAGLFLAAMLPCIAGWILWSAPRKVHPSDPYVMYYVDYISYHFYNVNSGNFLLFLRKNFESLLTAMAVPIMPIINNPLDKMVAQTIGVGMMVGVYRLTKERPAVWPYTLYALGHVGLLLVWHFPPDGRLLFPIFPLLLAGLSVEAARVGGAAWRLRNDKSQRAGVLVFATVFGAFLLVVLRAHYDAFFIVPEFAAQNRAMTAETTACVSRMQTEVAANEKVLTDNDALLYLTTGRHAMRMIAPFVHSYEDNVRNAELRLPEVAREQGFKYVMLNRSFLGRLTPEEEAQRYAFLRKHRDLEEMFSCGKVTVWRVRSIAQQASRGTD